MLPHHEATTRPIIALAIESISSDSCVELALISFAYKSVDYQFILWLLVRPKNVGD